MEDHSKNYRPEQEVQITNPIEKNRRSTDLSFLFLFLIILIIWLGVGISGLCARQRLIDDESQSDYTFMRTLMIYRSFINAPITSFSWISLIVLISSILFSLLGILLSKQFPKFIACVGMSIYIIGVIFAILYYLCAPSQSKPAEKNKYQDISLKISPIVSIFSFVLQVVFMIACLLSFMKVDQKTLYSIIKDCYQIVLGSPSLMFFSAFISLLGYAVLSFTTNALISNLLSDRDASIIQLEYIVISLGATSVLTFIYNFALMVISEYTINCYWKNDTGIGQIIAQISRYHLGTIAFSSTLLVPYGCSIVQALKHNKSWNSTECRPFYCISKIFLTLNMPCTALYYSSIYGAGFIRSVRKTFDVVLRRCLLYLATLGVADVLQVVATIIVCVPAAVIGTVSMKLSRHEQEIDKRNEELRMQLTLILYAICFPTLSYGFLIYCSIKALLINKIIILNKENHTGENSGIINRL